MEKADPELRVPEAGRFKKDGKARWRSSLVLSG